MLHLDSFTKQDIIQRGYMLINLHEARYDTASLHVDLMQSEMEVFLPCTHGMINQVNDVTHSADAQ